jgi:hypothetical protein
MVDSGDRRCGMDVANLSPTKDCSGDFRGAGDDDPSRGYTVRRLTKSRIN